MTSSSQACYVCPGVYVIDGGASPHAGQFTVNNGILQLLAPNATITTSSGDVIANPSYDPLYTTHCPGDTSGTGVAFVLTSSTCSGFPCSSVATLTISQGVFLNLGGIDSTQSAASGSTSNTQLPVETLFWQNRKMTTGSQNSGNVNGNAIGTANTNINGLLYFPTGNLGFSGNGFATSSCFEVVAWTLQVGGNPTLTADGCQAGTKKIPPPPTLTE